MPASNLKDSIIETRDQTTAPQRGELLGGEFANKSWNHWINWTIIVIFLFRH